jgi:hypothetical protein
MSTPVVDTNTLYGIATDLLSRMTACALSVGVTLPGRQFVYPSQMVADCPQVAVTFSGWELTPPAMTLGTMSCINARWMANLSVSILRESPALPSKRGVAPSVDQLNASAWIASQDAEVLLALVQTYSEIGVTLTLLSGEPTGGFQMVELNIQIPAF